MTTYKRHKQYRLPHYDYSSNGYYFVTICTKKRRNLLGEIQNDKMRYTKIGTIVKQYWQEIPSHYKYVNLDVFAIMPNHIHGIIIIRKNGGNTVLPDLLPNDPFTNGLSTVPTGTVPTKSKSGLQPSVNSLSIVVRAFKAAVTIYARRFFLVEHIWQSRFYDRIIRDDIELERVREYVMNNPAQWEADSNYLANQHM